MQKTLKFKLIILLWLTAPVFTGFASHSLGIYSELKFPPSRSSNILSTLDTQRLYFRPLEPRDSEAMIKILVDPESIEMCGQDFDSESAVKLTTSNPLLRIASNWKETIHFAVVLKENHQVIGMIQIARIQEDEHNYGLQNHELDRLKDASIGYAILKKLWGKGLATEAVKRIKDFSFYQLGVKRLVAETIPSNLASQRVLYKAGFEKIGEGPTSIGRAGLYFSAVPETGAKISISRQGLNR